MRQLLSLTRDQFERAADKLRHPKPGGRTEAAVDYGIDTTLLIEQLRLTPAERVKKLEASASQLEAVRGSARVRGRRSGT